MRITLTFLVVSLFAVPVDTQQKLSQYEQEVARAVGQSDHPLELKSNVKVMEETPLIPVMESLDSDQYNCGKWLLLTYHTDAAGQRHEVLYSLYKTEDRQVLGIMDPNPVVMVDNSKKVPTIEYREEDKSKGGQFIARLRMSQEDYDYATCLHRRS